VDFVVGQCHYVCWTLLLLDHVTMNLLHFVVGLYVVCCGNAIYIVVYCIWIILWYIFVEMLYILEYMKEIMKRKK
jgi:hypothetical protein